MNSSSSTAPGAYFRSAHRPLSRSRVRSYFWSPFLYHCRRRTLSNGKSAKVLFMANCGMRVAMDIGVIHDDVMGFYRVSPSLRLPSFGCKFSCKDMGRHWVHRSERVRGALDEFVSEFGFGRRQPRDSGATNLLRGSLIKASCRLVSWE